MWILEYAWKEFEDLGALVWQYPGEAFSLLVLGLIFDASRRKEPPIATFNGILLLVFVGAAKTFIPEVSPGWRFVAMVLFIATVGAIEQKLPPLIQRTYGIEPATAPPPPPDEDVLNRRFWR